MPPPTSASNRQVLEFLQLVQQLSEIASLLAIEPEDGAGRRTPRIRRAIHVQRQREVRSAA
jgi:hypothetical protein